MKKVSLRWKVIGMVVVLIIGLSVIIALYINSVVRGFFEKELQRRGIILAQQAAKSAESPILNMDEASLYELVDRVQSSGDVDYVLIEDDQGNLLAHTFQTENVSDKFVRANIPQTGDTLKIAKVIYRGIPYIDIAVPILGGELGTIRVGISLLRVKKQVNQIMKSLFVIVLIVLLGGIAMAIIFANSIVNPIVHLTEVANKISMGDFDVKIDVRSNDEIGELAQAIERMARSLQLAIERLRR